MFQMKNYLINKGFTSTYPIGVFANGKKEVFERTKDGMTITVRKAKHVSGIAVSVVTVKNTQVTTSSFDIPEDTQMLEDFLIKLIGKVEYKQRIYKKKGKKHGSK